MIHSDTQLAKDITRIDKEISSNIAESLDLAAIKEQLSGENDPPQAQPTRPAIDPEPGENDFNVSSGFPDLFVRRL